MEGTGMLRWMAALGASGAAANAAEALAAERRRHEAVDELEARLAGADPYPPGGDARSRARGQPPAA